jgi:membrane associated rhomboid family serine protease
MEEREAGAMIKLEAVRAESSKAELQDGPDAWWEFAVALCGVPVEYNDMPLQHRPIVTWLLAALIAVVSVIAFSDLESAIQNWGMVSAQFGRHYGLTFITSFLLHGSVLHLLGNLYYLVVFGDNTEDVLGKGRYLFLIALAALVGDVAHILLEPRADIPAIGASGGISGVLAYYCLRFPRANVGLVWWFHWFRLPVGVMFALWVVFQLVEAIWIRQGGATGVAVFAHLGGAAVGVAFWLTTRRAMATAARPVTSAA